MPSKVVASVHFLWCGGLALGVVSLLLVVGAHIF